MSPTEQKRPRIAFFGYEDVFEDFYPHYGVTQEAFATDWACTGNHAFVAVLQDAIGDVTWYEQSLRPEIDESVHQTIGCKIKFLPSSLLHRQLWRFFYLTKNAWRWRSRFRLYATIASYLAPLSLGLIKSIRKERPDFLFVQDYASGRFDILLLLALWMKIPLFTYHAGSTPDRYLGGRIRRYTLPKADLLIASNKKEAERMGKLFKMRPDQIAVILTPIDDKIFHPSSRADACRTLNINPDRRYLLYAGRLLDSVKRVSVLLSVFSRLLYEHNDVDLLIAGTGEDEAALKNQASRMPSDRVRFLGWISDDAGKRALYNAAECLVLPSVREGFPTVVGEALSCGTPVLGSAIEGIEELIDPGLNGDLFEPGNEQGLEQALSVFLSDAGKARSMREAALQTARKRVAPQAVAEHLRTSFLIKRQNN